MVPTVVCFKLGLTALGFRYSQLPAKFYSNWILFETIHGVMCCLYYSTRVLGCRLQRCVLYPRSKLRGFRPPTNKGKDPGSTPGVPTKKTNLANIGYLIICEVYTAFVYFNFSLLYTDAHYQNLQFPHRYIQN